MPTTRKIIIALSTTATIALLVAYGAYRHAMKVEFSRHEWQKADEWQVEDKREDYKERRLQNIKGRYQEESSTA